MPPNLNHSFFGDIITSIATSVRVSVVFERLPECENNEDCLGFLTIFQTSGRLRNDLFCVEWHL